MNFRKTIATMLAGLILAVACFALSNERRDLAYPLQIAALASVTDLDVPASPEDIQYEISQAVYLAGEVDIGDLPTAAAGPRTIVPTYSAAYASPVLYALNLPNQHCGKQRLVLGTQHGFTGLGGNFARADV